MDKRSLRIVFMGTPEFAVPSLKMLREKAYDVVGVITQPDRPRGRGHRVVASPVKQAAEELGLPVFAEKRISSAEGVSLLHLLKPDLLITVAFGQILSEEVLHTAPYGCINVHASLLPAYRGAAPIAKAIMEGETETGITTMRTVRELDAGPILLQDRIQILPSDTAGTLSQKLSVLGARTLCRTLELLLSGNLTETAQDESQATFCTTFPKGYGEIDWHRDAESISRFVRALNPSPLAFLRIGDEKIRVSEAEATDAASTGAPGTIISADARQGLQIAAADRVVSVTKLRRPGAREMTARESLRGRPLPACGEVGEGVDK